MNHDIVLGLGWGVVLGITLTFSALFIMFKANNK